jgi:phage tail-like protein
VEKVPSEAVQSWLRDVAAEWNGSGDMSRIGKIVMIDLLDVYQVSAAHWALRNAFPISWSGPSLTAKGSEIASETLVLEHEGFLEEER